MRTSHKLTSLLLTLAAMAVLAVSAMAQGIPGTPGTVLTETSQSPVSDQKAGSILFYNYYTSSTTNATEGTVFNITNTNTTQSVLVHLFFVDQSCAAKDFYVCLTRNQTSSFKAADFDPDTKGYLVAVATDGDGCPISFNYLIGDEYIKTSDGFNANLGAEAIAAVSTGVPTTDANGDTRNRLPGCDPTSATGTLKFDGTIYNQLPYTVALDNVGNVTDTETLFILNAVGGSLIDGGQSVGSVFGLLYNDIEQQLSFSFSSSRCQFTTKVGDAWPSTAPRFSSFVTRSGWIKLYSTGGRAYLGAAIARAKTAAGFSGGHNLHKLTYRANAMYLIPVFPTTCNQAIL